MVGETQIPKPRLSSAMEELNFTEENMSQTCAFHPTYVKGQIRLERTHSKPESLVRLDSYLVKVIQKKPVW